MDRGRRRFGLVYKTLEFLGRPFYYLLVLSLPSILFFIVAAAWLKNLIHKLTRISLPKIEIPSIHLPKFSIPPKLLTLIVVSTVSGISLVFIGLYLFKDLPSPKDLKTRQPKLTTHILDRHANELYKIYKDENRSLVSLEELPTYLIDATVSIEDKDFWNHSGFSITGIVRAIYRNWIAPSSIIYHPSPIDIQGGSTITQQLIKNTLLTPEKTWRRKIRELILSVWTETKFTKQEILEMYLNEVSYGGTAYGVQEAAQQYLGKNAADLSLAEAGLLAGLPAAPTAYSPFGINPERAKDRQSEVLRRMVEDKYITQTQADSAKNEPLKFSDGITNIKAPHFVMFVRDKLVEMFGEDMVNHGGLQVMTTLDLALQEFVQKTVSVEVENLKKLRVNNGAALVTNPQAGEILVMVGSKNYFDFTNDGQVNVTLRPRQPGSAIKPVMYSAALQRGFTPTSIIFDAPITFNNPGSKPYSPVNYDGKFHGPIPLRTALASSYNVPAVKVLSVIGVNAMIDQGEAMGIKTWGDRKRFGLSLTLGGGEITMADMAEVYGTLANYGVYIHLNPLLEVKDSKGEIIYSAAEHSQSNRALPAGVAYQLIDILSDPAARAPAFGTHSVLNIPGHDVAVKTGTTNSLRDNWTFGFTSDYVVATWVGNNDNTPMSYIASGITGASPIWAKIMQGILAGRQTPHEFLKPQDLVTVKICSLTGQLACEGCQSREEIFLPGTEPKEACRPETVEEIKRKQEETAQNRDKIIDGAATVR